MSETEKAAAEIAELRFQLAKLDQALTTLNHRVERVREALQAASASVKGTADRMEGRSE